MSSRYVWNKNKIFYDSKLLADPARWEKKHINPSENSEYCLCNQISLVEHSGHFLPADVIKTGVVRDVQAPFALFSSRPAKYFLHFASGTAGGGKTVYKHAYCVNNFAPAYWGRYGGLYAYSCAAYSRPSDNSEQTELPTMYTTWSYLRTKGDLLGKTSGPSQGPYRGSLSPCNTTANISRRCAA